KQEHTASNGKIFLRHQQVVALREIHMGNQNCANGEQSNDKSGNSGLKTNENCKATEEFNQADEHGSNGWNRQAERGKELCSTGNSDQFVKTGSDEKN